MSPERVNVVEAETVPVVEGHVYAVAMRDGDAPPGSMITSRTEGRHRDPRGPTGSAELVAGGTRRDGNQKRRVEPRSGVGLAHSTDEAAEGDEACGGKGLARDRTARGSHRPDAAPGSDAAESRARPRGSNEGQEDEVHGPAHHVDVEALARAFRRL